MADKTILDFPALLDTQDDDVIYVLREDGDDRDKHQTKDNFLQSIKTDIITEKTEDNGVEVEGVLLKDGIVITDTITEKTSSAGVSVPSGIKTDNVILKTKVIELGTWNMVSTNTISVTHGLDFSKIRGIHVTVQDDANTELYSTPTAGDVLESTSRINIRSISSTIIRISVSGGFFNSTDFDGGGNRGWVTIIYEA